MPRKPRSPKPGLSPGSLVHVGEKRSEQVRVDVMHYGEAEVTERRSASIEDIAAFRSRPGVLWVNVSGLHDVASVEKIGNLFGLHPLALEDLLNTTQRPKLEDYESYLFCIVKMLQPSPQESLFDEEQISMMLGPDFLLTFQEKLGDAFEPVRERIRQGKGRIRKMQVDYLAYALLDAVVDNYFLVLERAGEHIEALEEEMAGDRPGALVIRRFYRVRKEMIFLRRSVWPMREVLGALQREDNPVMRPATAVFLRDALDHSVQVVDLAEVYRDMLSGMLEIHLSSVSNRLNAVMKVLTVISTIFIPLTFITSVYGMNFAGMPELRWRWGYPAVLLLMAGLGLGMALYFKRKKWI
jgi:magnesium transporter